MSDDARLDRARGALVGLAVGDALGAPVEFDPPAAIQERRDALFAMPGGGGFGWDPGEFTDDTQMALLLGRRLREEGTALDLDRLAADFASWAMDPATSDVGVQTRRVLAAVHRGTPWPAAVGTLDPEAAGNGSLMRAVPAALVGDDLEAAVGVAREQSRVTHPNEWCLDACAVYVRAVRTAIDQGMLPPLRALAESAAELEVAAAVRLAETAVPPRMSGFVLHTLTGALWAVYGAGDFEEAMWRAVSLGRDADTVGAVAGGLAGARWGRGAIPASLADALSSRHPRFAGDYPADLEALAVALLGRG